MIIEKTDDDVETSVWNDWNEFRGDEFSHGSGTQRF